MKVMFIVYHDIRTNARSQEILECAKRLGDEIIFVSYSVPFESAGVRNIITSQGKRRYFAFINDAIKSIKNENPDIVILHDNYTAAILRLIHNNRKDICVIYDSSELYIDGKPKSLKQLIARHMRYFEKKYLKHADIVTAANIERAEIMRDFFGLKELPIVFDNIHRIDDEYDITQCEAKYGRLFDDDAFCIAYAGGISKRRKTFELTEVVGDLGNNYRLIILGSASSRDKKEFDLILQEKGFLNISYLGFIPRNEWRYILSRSHISVSAFAQDTVNNIYCASGKLYESLFEGKPILTSTNPPLKRICNRYKIGISTDNFLEGILELEKGYDEYCEKVESYINAINYEKRIDVLAEGIENSIRKNFRKEQGC